MAIYIDDLDRTIITNEVPCVFNALYADSLEELFAFCKSQKIKMEHFCFGKAVRYNVSLIMKRSRRNAIRWGAVPVKFGEVHWKTKDSPWD